jgi:hypothetical protein
MHAAIFNILHEISLSTLLLPTITSVSSELAETATTNNRSRNVTDF